MALRSVLESVLYAVDLDAAADFYHRVLGLEPAGKAAGRHVFFRCGGGMLLLFNPEHTSRVQTMVGGAPVPLHGARGPGHLAFRAESAELDDWHERLERHGVAIESEVVWPEGGRSLYFRDPAGNSLEIATPEVWGLSDPSS